MCKERRGPAERLEAAGLATLYSLYKSVKGAGRPLQPDAEGLHRQGADRDWNESLYFNFTDPEKRIGGYTRIGLLPNQHSDVGVIMIYAGGGRLLFTQQEGRAARSDGGLGMAGLSFRCLEPLWRWRLSYQGEMADLPDSRMLKEAGPDLMGRIPVSLDITFEGLSPPFNFKNADPGALAGMMVSRGTRLRDIFGVSRISTEHYEQACWCRGKISIDGAEIEIRGSGHRDHSWGVRDWTAPRLWTWLTCQFSDEVAFNLTRVAIRSVDVFNGFICRQGRNYPVRAAELETEFEDDGVTQRIFRFRMEDTGGARLEVEGRALWVIPLDLSNRGYATLVNEAMAEFRWEGRVGYGIAEYLHQLS